MSLINEALKRAEQAKTGRLAPQAAPPLKLVRPSRVARRRLSLPIILGGVGIVAVLAAGRLAMSRGGLRSSGPKQAAAASVDIAMSAISSKAASAEPSSAHETPADDAPQPGEASVVEVSPSGPTQAKLTEAPAKTVASLRQGPPSTPPDVTAPAGSAPDAPVKRATAENGVADNAPAEPKAPVVQAHETVASNFKLSGIMSSPTGTIAIINGCHMRVGETIDGAKITGIRTHSVQLEIDGQTVTLRM